MKVLLVADKILTFNIPKSYLKPRGLELIHYRNPIKGMDNIDEIDPEIILFSAEDFPRHWKPFLRFLRETRPKADTAFVLLKGESFSFDEAAKANHLGVNGSIREMFEDRTELQSLEALITRYGAMNDERNNVRYVPERFDDLEFILTHPQSFMIVTGSLYDLSPGGASFVPDDPKTTANIPAGSVIPVCSIKLGETYESFACRVVRSSERLGLRFIDPSEALQRRIIEYIDGKAERDLRMLLGDKIR